MRRFREVGIRPKTRHGQNFLIDLNLHRLLVNTADVQPNDIVLEIGTGTGGITTAVAPLAAKVITVEIDEQLFELASEELIDFTNVVMIKQDALRNKNKLNPHVVDAVEQALAEGPDRRFKLVANLPYNIATPIISNLLSAPVVPCSMTVTIQKELAERITAPPYCKDYSALSIWIQSQCDAEIVRIMPPSVFWPRPKVYSAILQISLNAEKKGRIPDLEYFHTFVRSLFFHRRKFLRSVLLSAYKGKLDKPAVDAVLEAVGSDPSTRAEQLSIEQVMKLCWALRAAAGN